MLNVWKNFLGKKLNQAKINFRGFFVLAIAIFICLFISSAVFSQTSLTSDQTVTEITKIKEQIVSIVAALQQLQLEDIKAEIEKIKKSITDKQEILKKVINVGIPKSEAIPDWILQELSASTQTTPKTLTTPNAQITKDQIKAQIEDITKKIQQMQIIIKKVITAGFLFSDEIPERILNGFSLSPQTTTKTINQTTITPVPGSVFLGSGSGLGSGGGSGSGGSNSSGSQQTSTISIFIPSATTIIQSALIPEINSVPISNSSVEEAIDGLIPIKITLANNGNAGSTNIHINPIGNTSGHIQFWVKGLNNNWHDVNFTSIGFAQGFTLPAKFTASFEIYIISDVVGSYPVTVNLTNVINSSTIIATASGTVTVNTPNPTNTPVLICNPDCGANGTCVATNTCTCQDGYMGATCDTVDPSVSGNFNLGSGPQTYTITGGHHSPNFTEATINPLSVAVGDTQIMSVKINDTYSVTSVEAQVETDSGTQIYPLSLVSGTNLNGTWQGSWVVNDTHTATYHTVFYAVDSNNESGSITLTWSDPCTISAGGDWQPTIDCAISGVNGADNGNINLNGKALTLSAGSTLVFNSGKSITMAGGTIAKGSGAQVKKTNLWMTDADADGYPSSTTQIAQDNAPTNGRRRNLLTNYINYTDGTGLNIDFNDILNTIFPGTKCNGTCTINNNDGTCGYQTNSQDLFSECTASWTSCNGNYRTGTGDYCSGTSAACQQQDSSPCATAGTCQTGGGCSSGSCTAVSNVSAYNEGTSCTGVCTGCDGAGSCVHITYNSQDTWGSNQCTASGYLCRSSGAPICGL